MKIRDLYGAGRRVYSFEFFPPKTEKGLITLENTIRELRDLSPGFVSVTYGAGGSTRDRTVDLVTRIQKDGITAMAHLTCVGASRDELAAVLDRLCEGGIENVIALRGIRPPAPTRSRSARRLRLRFGADRLHPRPLRKPAVHCRRRLPRRPHRVSGSGSRPGAPAGQGAGGAPRC
jgi:hypothetical protein